MTPYETCGCGADCYIRDFEEEDTQGRCWGKVHAIARIASAKINSYIHTCYGHHPLYDGGEYRVEQPALDKRACP